MLARGRKASGREAARVATFLLAAVLAVLFLAPSLSPARADAPTEVPSENATRTVTWTMNTTTNLTSDNVTVGLGQASLSWVQSNLTWSRAKQIVDNGTLDPSMTWNASGVSLRTNWTNYVKDPAFATNASWQYQNGTSDGVTASRNESAGLGELGAAGSRDQTLWESMDHVSNWTGAGGAAVNQNGSTPTPHQGSGTMGIVIAVPTNSAGAVNLSLSPLNWSSYDRLILWVYLSANLSATFNVTAQAGLSGPSVTTVAQSLDNRTGWQELVVDLDQLGTSEARNDLYKIGFRFNSPSNFSANTWFNVDDARLGSARVFNETALIAQTVRKANATSSRVGSARLSFDWCLLNNTGAETSIAQISLGPAGNLNLVPLGPTAPTGEWHAYSADVSAATSARGSYNVTFALTVAVNTTAPYRVTLLVDNVTLFFPEATNGTFTSSVLSLGEASEYLNMTWSGTLPSATNVSVRMRTGNSTDPSEPDWSQWETLDSPGVHALNLPGARRFQLTADLNTTNASLSPTLERLSFTARHRQSLGYLTSDLFPADVDFIRWHSFDAQVILGPGTSIQFMIGNSTSWSPVVGSNLTAYSGGPRIQWLAGFHSNDGLATPDLIRVTMVYEYLGPLAHVKILASPPVNGTVGHWTHLSAVAFDAGWHPLDLPASAFSWSGGDPEGRLYNNGSYLPAEAGNWNVTVSALGFSDTILVIVARGQSSDLPLSGDVSLWLPYALAILAAAGIGFAVYELAVRRMFAIDDVFLIGKDGRLMMHNTRRMRADRDEDILSGMLTAIMSFLRDQDPEENGELRRFQVGGKTTLLERGSHVYLTAVYSGRVPGWAGKDLHRFMADLEARFGEAFAHWDGSPEDLHGLKEFMGRFVTHVRYHGTRGTAA
jgi:hypothetical protein